jgi:excisionase family DNA binding protein
MDKLLLTVDEAAELLSVTRWKVFELIRRQELQSAKIGGLRRVPVKAVQEYVDGLSTDSGAA